MKTIKLNDWETVIDKYDILTCEKEDSLGQTMKLKELLDLYWNRVEFEYNGISYEAYKSTSGYYNICETWNSRKELHKEQLMELLFKDVKVSAQYDTDSDGYPFVECEVL